VAAEAIACQDRSMSKLIWFGLFAGSALGGYLPTLFGAGMLSFAGVGGSMIGGLAGIFVGYKLGERWGL
jgi:hypothetical protein